MWEWDHEEGWAPKSWFFQIVVLAKTLESSLGSKEIKPVNSKRNQPWMLIGWTDAETEAPMSWAPDVKSWLTGKDPDAGKIDSRRRRGKQRMRWLDSFTSSMDMNLSKLGETAEDRWAWCVCAAVHGITKSQAWLSDQTRLASQDSRLWFQSKRTAHLSGYFLTIPLVLCIMRMQTKRSSRLYCLY